MVKALLVAVAAALCVTQSSCSSDNPVAPEGGATVPVDVHERLRVAGEVVPGFAVNAVSNDLFIQVTHRALCSTLVNANVIRDGNRISVVTHISANPLADCIDLSGFVVDYSVRVSGAPAGPVLVRLFEAEGENTPVYLGSKSVAVRTN
jgi:hypothetical protein